MIHLRAHARSPGVGCYGLYVQSAHPQVSLSTCAGLIHAGPAVLLAAQDQVERFLEIPVQESINARVEGGVEVSEPRDRAPDLVAQVALCTVGQYDVHEEERQPTYAKDAHDYPQRPDGLGVCHDLLGPPAQTSPHAVRADPLQRDLELLDLAGLVLRHHQDAKVHVEHDGQRQVERGEGRDGGVDAVDAQRALGAGVEDADRVVAVPPEEDGDEGDGRAAQPHERDHEADALPGDQGSVSEGFGDGPEPVQGDDAQVKDGRGAAHDVAGYPEVARDGAEAPLPVQVVDDGEGHHERGHRDVGSGQARQQQIGDGSESPEFGDHYEDQDVADEGHGDQHGADYGSEDAETQLATCYFTPGQA